MFASFVAKKGLHGFRRLCSTSAARTVVFHHDACVLHAHTYTHPEQPERVRASLARLRAAKDLDVEFKEAPLVDEEHILAVHSQKLWERLKGLDVLALEEGKVEEVDGDTFLNGYTIEATKRAAGAMVAAVDHVFSRKDGKAFCCTRPPGHHANHSVSMGFCLVNHVVVGLKYARKKYGISRVAVIDFDVHHGNGTQDLVWDDPHAFFVSTHQYPMYPGTSGEEFRRCITEYAIPFLRQKAPELVIVSAGFDAHKSDPLGGMQLEEEDFAYATKEVVDLAKEVCEGRVVSVLEGGYNIEALAGSVLEHVKELARE